MNEARITEMRLWVERLKDQTPTWAARFEELIDEVCRLRDGARVTKRAEEEAQPDAGPPLAGYLTIPEYARRTGVPVKRCRAAVARYRITGRPRGFSPEVKQPKSEYLASDIEIALEGRAPYPAGHGWGGKRKGAGRPPGPARPTVETMEDAEEWARKKIAKMRSEELARAARFSDPLAAAWAELERGPHNG